MRDRVCIIVHTFCTHESHLQACPGVSAFCHTSADGTSTEILGQDRQVSTEHYGCNMQSFMLQSMQLQFTKNSVNFEAGL